MKKEAALGNSVVLFNTGIGAFERVVELTPKKPTTVTLLFPTASLGDVIGSLKIEEGVKQLAPPSYSSKREKPALELNPTNITKDLWKLSGAEIEYSTIGGEKHTATLMGGETKILKEDNLAIEVNYLIVRGKNGICYLPVNGPERIAHYDFTCGQIRSEIEKALNYNIENLKPNSTPVTLLLQGSEDKKTVRIRYAAPTPAWKMTYRLAQVSDGFSLSAYAVVDNNSDDDWTNYKVAVGTGAPITFPMTLANIRIPNRGPTVDVVQGTVQGAVETDSGGMESARMPKGGGRGMGGSAPRALQAVPMMAAALSAPGNDYEAESMLAGIPAAEVSEAGDEHVFTCPNPATIAAHQSALLFLFALPLPKAKKVYYFNVRNNETRPMRAIALTNEADYMLGRGNVEVEEGGVHVGMGMLSDSKPSQSAMICYSVGLKIKVKVTKGKETQSILSHKLDKGLMLSEWTVTQRTVYIIWNFGDSEDFYFDHNKNLSGSKVEVQGGTLIENLKDEVARCKISLSEGNDNEVIVTETFTKLQRIENVGVVDWIERNPDSPFLKTTDMEEINNLSKQAKTVREEIATGEAAVKTFKEEQERARKNLESLKKAEDRAKFESKIPLAEDEINKLEKDELPGKRTRLKDLVSRRDELVNNKVTFWSDPNKKK